VDWLRSCYRSRWNLPGAGEVNGRFFWSADGAPPYPDWNYIHSRNWHAGDGTPWPEFGELEDARQTWLSGALGQIFPNAVNVGDGSCIGSDLVGPVLGPAIGLAQGIDRRCYSVPLPPETHGCAAFDPSPQLWKLDLQGIVDEGCADCAALNQVYTLTHTTGCTWISPHVDYCTAGLFPQRKRWVLIIGASIVLLSWMNFGGSLPTFSWQGSMPVGNWQAFGPNTITATLIDGSGFCTNWPSTMTLTAGL